MRLNLNLCLLGGGQIDSNRTYSNETIVGVGEPLTIYIKDSRVNNNPDNYSPLEVSKYTVTEGALNNKDIRLKFENDLGTITMIGEYSRSSDWFAGRISFDNKVNFIKSEKPWGSQDFGEFYVEMRSLSRNCR